MINLQNILSRKAKYKAGEIANRVMERFASRHSLPFISSYPPAVAACAQIGGDTYVSETKHVRREHVHQTLQMEIKNRLGYRIGEKSHYASNSYVGYCAEPNAVNALLKHERLNNLDDVYFGDTYRPRTGVVVPPCGNCQRMFKNVIR